MSGSKVGFAYTPRIAILGLLREECAVVLVPTQEEDSDSENGWRDDWILLCFADSDSIVENSLRDAKRTELESGPIQFSVVGMTLGELAGFLEVNVEDIIRLTFDSVLDEHYFPRGEED